MLVAVLLLAMNIFSEQVFSNPSSALKSDTQQKMTVLMYHNIAPETSKNKHATISVEQFKEHLKTLIDNGYHVITMEQFQKFIQEGGAIPDNSLLITFDDGYESFYRYAYPAMKQAGVTGSVFVIGAYTDMYNPDALPHLTWDEMRELKKNGMGVFNHSYNSHYYAQASELGMKKPELSGPLYLSNQSRMETNEEFRRRIRSDMAFMEKRLSEELGEAPGILAIPFGVYNKALLEEGSEAGISLFFTTKEGVAKPGQHEIPRINAGKPDFNGEQLIESIRKAALK
jgi:poly-beta-1,6-N-acetyl-D-glucosamine N-deacetylase